MADDDWDADGGEDSDLDVHKDADMDADGETDDESLITVMSTIAAEEPDRSLQTSLPQRDLPPPEFPPSSLKVDDPFQYEPTIQVSASPDDVHLNKAVYIIYLAVMWLHAQFHLPFRACNALLIVIGLAFQAAGATIDPPMRSTLASVIAEMHAEPRIKILPVCPGCRDVYPSSCDAETICTTCGHLVFDVAPTPAQQRKGGSAREIPKPYLQFPTKSVEAQLAEVLSVPGMEDTFDAWRKPTRFPGVYNDFFDGAISREIHAPDGSPFFQHDLQELPNGDLAIGVTLGADW